MPAWPFYGQSSADTSDGVDNDFFQAMALEGDERLRLQCIASGTCAAKVSEAFLAHGEDDCPSDRFGSGEESLGYVERDGDRRGVVANARPGERQIVLVDLQRSFFVEDRVNVGCEDEARLALSPFPNEIADFVASTSPWLIANPFADPGEPRLLGKGRPRDSSDIDYVIY